MVVVVSEENGQISLVERARIVRNLTEAELARAIQGLLDPAGGRRGAFGWRSADQRRGFEGRSPRLRELGRFVGRPAGRRRFAGDGHRAEPGHVRRTGVTPAVATPPAGAAARGCDRAAADRRDPDAPRRRPRRRAGRAGAPTAPAVPSHDEDEVVSSMAARAPR